MHELEHELGRRVIALGSAPRQITATDTINANTVTRPVYPYPLVPKYNGTGSTSDASSFHPVLSPHAQDYSRWIGNYLFYQPVDASQRPREDTRRGAHTHTHA